MDIYYFEYVIQSACRSLNQKLFKEAAWHLNKIHYNNYAKSIDKIKLTRPQGLVNLFNTLIEYLNYYYANGFVDINYIKQMYNIIRSYRIREIDQLLAKLILPDWQISLY